MQVRLGIHIHAAVFGFHIALVGDAAAGGGHGHRGTGLYIGLVEKFFLGGQADCTLPSRQIATVGQRRTGRHREIPSSCHCLFVGHAAAGSQPCILAGFHHAQVVQVCLGVHDHIAVFGFHITLVGDAAGIGSQIHTLAARYGALVVQVGLGVHGHATALGFHIAFVGDAASSGSHAHRRTCLYDALVEDVIGCCQFHLVGGDQTLVDHAFGGIQDDFIPSQAVFILQRPGRIFMEPAAAHGQGTCGLQIGFVVDQADAFCNCHRPVDGQVVHRTVHVVADGNVLCLAVIVEGNGQVLTAAAADDHIGGIAAVLHGHVLEVVEDFLVIQLGSALQVDAGSGLQIGCECRDGMARSLADMSAGLQGQGIRGQAAFGQVDGAVTGQAHRIGRYLAVQRRCFVIFAKAQVGFRSNRNRMARNSLQGAEQQESFCFPGLALAGQVDVAIFCLGIDGRTIPQDAYTAVLRTDAARCLQIKQAAGIEISLCRSVRAHEDVLRGIEHHVLAGIETGKLQIVAAHTADIHAAVCQSRQAARQVDGNFLICRTDVSTATFEDEILALQVGTAIRQGVGHAGFAQNADIAITGRYLAQFQDSILVLSEGTTGYIDIAIGLDVQFTFGFDAHRHLAVDAEHFLSLVVFGIAYIRNVGIDDFLQVIETCIRGNILDQHIFGRFVRADVFSLECDIVAGDIGLLELRIRTALLLIDNGIADGIEQFILRPTGASLLQISQMIFGCIAFSQVVVSTGIIAIAVFQDLIVGIVSGCFFIVFISSLQLEILLHFRPDAGLVFSHVFCLFLFVLSIAFDQTEVFPALDEGCRIAAVNDIAAGQGIDEAARRIQHHIAVRGFDDADTHIAVFGQMDIAFGRDVDTAGKRVQRVHSGIRCFHLQGRRIRTDASLPAHKINTIALDSRSCAILGQIAQNGQTDIALRVLRLNEIDMTCFAIGTVNGDVHIAAAGIGRVEFHRIAKGLDGNIRQAVFGTELDVVSLEQAAILVDGTFLGSDGDGRARTALAGLDPAGQGDTSLTRHIDGRIAILIAKEADIDAVIRLDTAHILLGRTRIGIPFCAFPMEPA